jgi:Ser/Thr protein kinase RdoA (MazF antagonist)
MSEFDDLTAVHEAISTRLLDQYGLSHDSTVTLLGVSENANFEVSDPQSQFRGVFRIHRHDYHQRRDINSELQWMRAIRQDTDLLIPDPVAASDGQMVTSLPINGSAPRHAVLFTRVPGRNLTLAEATPEVYRRLGTISAHLHEHARGWVRPEWFHRHSWNLDSMLGTRARFGYWGNHPQLHGEDRRLLENVAAVVSGQIEQFSAEPDVIGLAHGDLHVLNLMVDGDDLWAIDFDDCGISWYMQDIAAALACFEPGPKVTELADAWVKGYETFRPLTPAEQAILGDFVMLRRLLLLGWSATHPDARVPGINRDLIEVTTEAARDRLRLGSVAQPLA